MSECEAKAGIAKPSVLDDMAIDALSSCRERLFAAIERALLEDGHCKSYEGGFSIRLPNYFHAKADKPEEDQWEITLDCYLIGPSRHYAWTGRTLWEAVHKCVRNVDRWILALSEEP